MIIDVILLQFNQFDDGELVWYKPMDLGCIANAIESVTWQQSMRSVATELLSNLILAYGLPNTNHQTSIALLDYYSSSVEEELRQPETIQSAVDVVILPGKTAHVPQP